MPVAMCNNIPLSVQTFPHLISAQALHDKSVMEEFWRQFTLWNLSSPLTQRHKRPPRPRRKKVIAHFVDTAHCDQLAA